MSNIKLGQNGEKIAEKFLLRQGYKILERNRHFSRFCEIDIIALDKDTLVFVEVKTRKTDICGHPLEAITKTKSKNIKTGLSMYLQENPSYKKFRIDAISILLKPKLEIKHLKNIYSLIKQHFYLINSQDTYRVKNISIKSMVDYTFTKMGIINMDMMKFKKP